MKEESSNQELSLVAQIKEAESYSQQAVISAHKKKEELIAKAKDESVFLVKDSLERFQRERELKLRTKKEELEKKKLEILNEGEKEEKDLEKKFQSRKDKAIEFLLKKFEERF